MIFFKILNFHDISMTGKVTVIFPGFQGFPGAVRTLVAKVRQYSLTALKFNQLLF